MAHLFIRDPVSLFKEKLHQNIEDEVDHFEVSEREGERQGQGQGQGERKSISLSLSLSLSLSHTHTHTHRISSPLTGRV